jgi:hypothetical protein
MLRREVARGPKGRVLLLDTITALEPEDAGAMVVTGSHGGRSAAAFALALPLPLVVFNDAGVGKDGAGIVALDLFDAQDRAAACVSHQSARIGEAEDAWDHGVLSHVNASAQRLGLAGGMAVRASLLRAIGAE